MILSSGHESFTKSEDVTFRKPVQIIILFILATIPIIFGSIHPIIYGSYVSLILLCPGLWLILVLSRHRKVSITPWMYPPLIILGYMLFTAIPLPVGLLHYFSPHRAEAVRAVMELADQSKTAYSISYFPQSTISHFIFTTALFIFYLILRYFLKEHAFFKKILAVIVIVGFIEAAYGLFQAVYPSIGVLWLTSYTERFASGTFISRNQYAAFLNLCWPIVLATGFWGYHRSKIRAHKKDDSIPAVAKYFPAFLFSVAIMMLAIIFSGSRGGILSMCLSLVLMSFFLGFSWKSRLAIICSILAFVMIYGGMIGFDAVIHRFMQIPSHGTSRIKVWMASMTMLEAHPWAGIGVGAYATLSRLYLHDFPNEAMYYHPHNEYVELVVEFGVPVMILLVSWVGAGMFLSAKGLLARQSKKFSSAVTEKGLVQMVGAACFCAFCGLFLHMIVDFPLRFPAYLVYATTLLALMNHASDEIEDRQRIFKIRSSNP